MANSGFDPLRDDPFATIQAPTPAEIIPVTDPNHPRNEWGLAAELRSETNGDIFQFDNTKIPSNDMIRTTKRRSNSYGSASSLGSRSAKSSSRVLNDSTFAPPPEVPIARDYTQSLFHLEDDLNPMPPPDFNEITHSGYCLARISMRTLVLKKWKRVFWISYGGHTLLFFREKLHFDDWAMNPHLSTRQRELLVKLRIDVQTPNKSTRKDTERIRGFHASVIKAKLYKAGGLLHQFKLDKWTDQGPTIAAAFGSPHPDEVKELHLILSEMIQNSPMNAIISTAMAQFKDTRDGDSSGHFPSDYSVGSNPTFARAVHQDDKSYNSGYSTRSAGSAGSKKNYMFNTIKSVVSSSSK